MARNLFGGKSGRRSADNRGSAYAVNESMPLLDDAFSDSGVEDEKYDLLSPDQKMARDLVSSHSSTDRPSDVSYDLVSAVDTFEQITADNEVPKIGKVMRHLDTDTKQNTLNDKRSEATRNWEIWRKGSWTPQTIANKDKGLDDIDVQKLLEVDGYNELPGRTAPRFYKILIKNLLNIVPIFLFIQAAFYMVMKQFPSAIGYFTPGVGCVLIAAIGEYRTGKLSADDDGEKTKMCRVIRNGGQEQEIDPRELVRGDTIKLDAGDFVPADCRILVGTDVSTIEMTLTGEPDDIKKKPAGEYFEHDLGGKIMFPEDIVLSSTVYSAGVSTCIVFATGLGTKVGAMASELTHDKDPMFPVKKAMNRFSSVCVLVGGGVFLFVFLWAYLMTYREPMSPERNEFDRVLLCILIGMQSGMSALPVAILPVSLVLLNKALLTLKKMNAKVKRASSVDVLGCVTVICSDKTGTISSGKMTAVKLSTFGFESNKSPIQGYSFYPYRGFHPSGGLWQNDTLGPAEKKACDEAFENEVERVNYENALKGVGIQSIDYCSESNNDVYLTYLSRSALLAFTLNSHETKLKSDVQEYSGEPSKTSWDVEGNMSEGALVVAGRKAGFDCGRLEATYPRVYQVAFNSQRKMALTVHKIPNAGTNSAVFGKISCPGATYFAVIKGAQDRLNKFVKATPSIAHEGDEFAQEVSSANAQALQDKISEQTKAYNQDGLRALLCVGRALTESDWNTIKEQGSQEVFDALLADKAISPGGGRTGGMKNVKGGGADRGFSQVMVMGLVGIMDPPKHGVKEAVEKVNGAGVRVVMITGDHKDTAEYIATATSVVRPEGACKDVREAKQLRLEDGTLKSDAEIDDMVKSTCVWARAQPVDKIVIVESFQRLGHVCAMTGDGVNDTAALHGSDMGIAMGITGTEVAQAEADMILLDDNFATIVNAIEEGRKIFDQISKFALYALSCNFTMIIQVILCMVFRLPMPWYGLATIVIGGVVAYLASMAFSFGKASPPDMTVPPRRKKASFLVRSSMYAMVIPFIFVASALCFTAYYASLKTFLGTTHLNLITSAEGWAAASGEISDFHVPREWRTGKLNEKGTSEICTYGWAPVGNDVKDLGEGEDLFKMDLMPFHCRVVWQDIMTGWPLKGGELDQWGHDSYNQHTDESWAHFGYVPDWEDTDYVHGLNQALFAKGDTDWNKLLTRTRLRKNTETDKKPGDDGYCTQADPCVWVWEDTATARQLPIGHAAHYGVMAARGVIFFVLCLVMAFHVLVIASGREFMFKPKTLKLLNRHAIVLLLALIVGGTALWTPWINQSILNFIAPTYAVSVIAMLIFILLVFIFDESIKMLFFKPRYDSRQRKRRKIAQLAGIGLMQPWASKKTVANTSIETLRQRGAGETSAMTNQNMGMMPGVHDHESDDPSQLV